MLIVFIIAAGSRVSPPESDAVPSAALWLGVDTAFNSMISIHPISIRSGESTFSELPLIEIATPHHPRFLDA